ncbi:MAG: flagellin [Bdellovibrionales bacterium RIFCSPHIGHO2_01_FULL_40_29]|nr:MAG: flagellin [Bdellovibrionales bacterium RIFCSPHIGHO2_01_FULL_40_29]OFZ33943.1 MAG: flagellin [Bdellovibrionales bacterium RIFCSPHIGHO2_02_FULL_40_15]
MGMRITTNVAAINSQRNMIGSQRNIQNSMAQLSSGSRINRSADDAAGLAISENMRAQIRSSTQARRNANDGISMVQVAEGGLNEVSNIVTRIRELGIQAASDTVGERERGFIDTEVQQLKQEMERIANTTSWNTTKLLDGSTPVFDFQVGLYSTEDDVIAFDTSSNVATLDALGLVDVDYTTKEGARSALQLLDDSQAMINGMRSNMGALQNRLTSTVDTLAVTEENLAAANSRIRDTDVALASSDMAKNSVMLQAGTSTLAQANQTTQLALKLLG